MDEPKSAALPTDLADLSPEGPAVSVVFGSASDWPTMKAAVEILEDFGVACEHGVVSAHRTPDRLAEYARGAAGRGVKVIIGAAGGAAHLPGMIAAWTTLPVLGVPIKSRALSGVDSLLSIVQMPGGVPVGTLAIGDAGAKNAALLALRILGSTDEGIARKLDEYARGHGERALQAPLDR
ncbi:N5-carboxyaminoimidazole ribonucleotide mutase [Planctomycetes bacterium Poly30]|uniref:N5-carboxyaminoimidazole ribonucleotide mutase n=1 Tax=Saltatorellus ferox TaxID=2528018 RepID=A0A518EX25_9BACT|nr:N5-carboxyaminoimidazole ribonucleotide mutase [Planctomycetes bacterium Poly30]